MKSIHRDEYTKLIEKLVTARKEQGITQIQLSKKLRKPQSYVSKYENKERRLDVLEFIEIAKALDIDAKELIG